MRNKPARMGTVWEEVANIEGQYAMQKTVTHLISARLHDDNRYFGSVKRGFWPRMQYALAASVRARHDNGKLYISIRSRDGIAAGACVSTPAPAERKKRQRCSHQLRNHHGQQS